MHPEKTKVVDLREGREGFDFLGCHFRARVSGRLLERGWGSYFRYGNAADKFTAIDRYVAWRVVRLMVKRHGRNIRAGQIEGWNRKWLGKWAFIP